MSAAAIPAEETPERPDRRALLLGGCMALTAGVVAARMPRRHEALIPPGKLDHAVPLRIGGWTYQTSSGLVLPPPDQLARLLYDTQVTRTYASDIDLPVMMLLAYGSSQSGALQIHRPEICYPASGFHLSATDESALAIGGPRPLPVRRFSASSDTRAEQVLYWTRIGEYLPVSWAAQRVAVMRANLKGDVPDGLLVRLSVATRDVAGGQAVLARFADAMIHALTPTARRMLIANY
jgi:EpsI family protein